LLFFLQIKHLLHFAFGKHHKKFIGWSGEFFSSFGLVHSRLRNRLGVAKAGKLVFLFKLPNRKPLDADDDYDLDQ